MPKAPEIRNFFLSDSCNDQTIGTLSATTMISVIMLKLPFAIPNLRMLMQVLSFIDVSQSAFSGTQVNIVAKKHDIHQAITIPPAI